MRRSLSQRLLRLAVQVSIFLALMIGVLLRVRSANPAIWEVLLRPVVVFAFGMLLLSGRRWARWPFAALASAYAWWYFTAAMRGTLPMEYRIGTAAGALLEVAAGLVVLLVPAVPDTARRTSAPDTSTAP